MEMQLCRNCTYQYDIEETERVRPSPGSKSAYRYCKACYDKLVEVRQAVPDWLLRDGVYVLMWEGDPVRPLKGIGITLRRKSFQRGRPTLL